MSCELNLSFINTDWNQPWRKEVNQHNTMLSFSTPKPIQSDTIILIEKCWEVKNSKEGCIIPALLLLDIIQ